MKTLLITYSLEGKLPSSFNSLLAAASNLGSSCDVAVFTDSHVELVNYAMISQVFMYQDSYFTGLLAEAIAPIVAKISHNYTHVLVASDSFGKDVLPRVAGILDVAQLSEVVELHSDDVFSYSAYAGNAIYKVSVNSAIKLMTIRTTSFAKNIEISDVGLVVLQAEFTKTELKTRFIQTNLEHNSQDLTRKDIVVSGGKSLLSRDNFNSLIGGLAHKLDAGVGASRAAVEEGFISNAAQVGQTGISVSPQLYIAVGISGAMQHIAGMKDSRFVIAINNDENAQIFEYADYGIVADLFEVIPQLIDIIK